MRGEVAETDDRAMLGVERHVLDQLKRFSRVGPGAEHLASREPGERGLGVGRDLGPGPANLVRGHFGEARRIEMGIVGHDDDAEHDRVARRERHGRGHRADGRARRCARGRALEARLGRERDLVGGVLDHERTRRPMDEIEIERAGRRGLAGRWFGTGQTADDHQSNEIAHGADSSGSMMVSLLQLEIFRGRRRSASRRCPTAAARSVASGCRPRSRRTSDRC